MEKVGPLSLAEEPENWAGARVLWTAVTQRKWLLLFTVTGFVSAIMFYVLRLPPQYLATATSIIDVEAPQILGREVQEVVNLGTSGAYFDPRQYMLTQYRIVQSLALSRRVVDSLNLGAEPTFTASGPGKPAQHDQPCAAMCAAMGHGIAGPLPSGMAASITLRSTITALIPASDWVPPQIAVIGSHAPRGPPRV